MSKPYVFLDDADPAEPAWQMRCCGGDDLPRCCVHRTCATHADAIDEAWEHIARYHAEASS